MTDQEGKRRRADEAGDGWVTLGGYWSNRGVPGIDDVQEATYVAPPARIRRRTLIVGCAIALASIAIGAALVFAAGSNDNGPKLGKSELDAAATLTSSSSTSSTTTTTAPPASSTTAPTTATTGAAVSGSSATPAVAAIPPTPRATADVALAPYQPVALPAGVTATLTSGSCRWLIGGVLQASGTITSTMSTGHTWNMTMHWLQNSRDLAVQSGLMDLQPGESKPWSLTISQPNPPADLACSLAIS